MGLAGVAVAATATAELHPVTALELENTSRGGTVRIPIRAGEVFSVTSQHSMYDQPVTEEFLAAADGRIVLVAVSSPSAAVREYLGITGPGERHAIRRIMPEIVFRVAAGTPQRLRVRGVERSFLALGDHGDRLVLRAIRTPALAGAPSAPAGTSP
jgi:hypothetical protein